MGKGGKRRFDKKNAVTFSLVHRDQRDPLAADENASKYVLQPVLKQGQRISEHIQDTLEDHIQKDLTDEYDEYWKKKAALDHAADDPSLLPHEYDYTRHMREMGDGKFLSAADTGVKVDAVIEHIRGQYTAPSVDKSDRQKPVAEVKMPALPDSVFGSYYEEETGILERDVNVRGQVCVEAGEDFFDALEGSDAEQEYEELEDDFFSQLVATTDDSAQQHDEDDEKMVFDDSQSSTDAPSKRVRFEFDDDVADLPRNPNHQYFDDDEDDEDELANLPAGDTDLDAAFERMMAAGEYDDDQIGGLYSDEGEDTVGQASTQQYDAVMDDFLAKQKRKYQTDEDLVKNNVTNSQKVFDQFAERDDQFDETKFETDTRLRALFQQKEKNPWDCQSIVSTYTNTENHPNLIGRNKRHQGRIKLSKDGMPLGVLGDGKKPEKESDDDSSEGEMVPVQDLGVRRNKTETKAEKKARKQAIKEQRRNRRQEKKQVKEVFKAEEARQRQQVISVQKSMTKGVRRNL